MSLLSVKLGASTGRGVGTGVLLVIAHPDDESMFFAPMLTYLRNCGVEVKVLCLSTGNAEGLGKVREKELIRACKEFKIPESSVTVVDDDALQDGMNEVWNQTAVRSYLQRGLLDPIVKTVITFDREGVSGHPNHRAVFRAAKHLYDTSKGDFTLLTLDTCTPLAKYGGVCMAVLGVLQSLWLDTPAVLSMPWSCWRAMQWHRSQLVWYRCLYLAFSRYTWLNTFKHYPLQNKDP